MSNQRLDITTFDPMRCKSDDQAVLEGYFWSPEKALKVERFIESFCRLSVGRWAGQPLALMPWQQDFIYRCYGWVHRDTGLRRFREAYLEVAKKQGKSPLISALSLHHLIADGENSPEIHICAAAREQANIVYREAARMVQQDDELKCVISEIPSAKRLLYPTKNGVLVARSSESGSADGVQSSFTIFDELHRQPNRDLWDVFQYAGASRQQPLLACITTAGEPDPNHVCYQQHNRALAVQSGSLIDTRFLGVVHGPPEGPVDIDDRRVWRMANPSMGITIDETDFAKDLEKAKQSPAALANFKRLRLNIWEKQVNKFISPEIWNAQPERRTEFEIAEAGELWFAGLDLSSVKDLSCYVRVAGNMQTGVDVYVKAWIPEETAVQRSREEGLPYLEYADRGWITLIPGPVIDLVQIEEFILDDVKTHPVKSIYADFYRTQYIGSNLIAASIDFKYMTPGSLSMHQPISALETLVLERKLRHGGDAILTNCMLNAVVDTANKNQNMMLIKSKSTGRIDAAVACVEAIAGMLDEYGYGESKSKSDIDEEPRILWVR